MLIHPEFDPVALQLGGSDPALLARAAKLGEQYGYREINLNVGCPSDRVQSGRFGACLMAEPEIVADCVIAMREAVGVPIVINGEPHSYNGFGISCFGANDGKIELNPTGGKLPSDPAGYTYSWTGPNGFYYTQQNPIISKLDKKHSGEYKLTVKSEEGCVNSKTVNLAVASIDDFVAIENEFMKAAFNNARSHSTDALQPTGAVVVLNNEIIGNGANHSFFGKITSITEVQ
jgi:hypothetical protein